jgi:hypothetical protein
MDAEDTIRDPARPDNCQPRVEPIIRQGGSTETEGYLARLCEKSFLSLWSYPGLFRDQGKQGVGDGKEVCDLLVIFGDDVIIFSDKDCAFPNSGSLDRDWSRWYKRAVRRSAEQVWGAERWIREHPDRLFVDRKCQMRLPIELPKHPQFHRIVVAHDASRRFRELLGGTSGSLFLFTAIKGTAHENGPIPANASAMIERLNSDWSQHTTFAGNVMPFTIGDIEPDKGFIHVLDDPALDVVLTTCDTIADFVHYLASREALIRSGKLIFSPGEEDLLAYYLPSPDGGSERGFGFPPESNTHLCIIAEGQWEALIRSEAWRLRQRLNQVSYSWDKLIETHNKHILAGTSPVYRDHPFSVQELAVRSMARENRVRRRGLAYALATLLQKKHQPYLTVRVILPHDEGLPHYIFLLVRRQQNETLDEYYNHRESVMHAYAVTLKRQFRDAKAVVVVAMEPYDQKELASSMVLYVDLTTLTPEDEERAKQYQEECGFLTKLEPSIHLSLPDVPVLPQSCPTERKAQSARNSLCPCGSGKKFKKCCMRKPPFPEFD